MDTELRKQLYFAFLCTPLKEGVLHDIEGFLVLISSQVSPDFELDRGFLKDHTSKENRRILRELLCCSVFASFDLSWSTNQMKLHMVGIKHVRCFPFHFIVNRIAFMNMLVFFLVKLKLPVLSMPPDKNENLMGSVVLNSNRPEMDGKDVLSPVLSPPGHHVQVNMADQKVEENVPKDLPSEDMWAYGEVNMEASITTDDVIRAGGFGARDDISSFLPVASDSTDFEATIRDARDYEEPQGEICRPGLGWTEATEAE